MNNRLISIEANAILIVRGKEDSIERATAIKSLIKEAREVLDNYYIKQKQKENE